MSSQKKNFVELEVIESLQEDVDKGTVRVSSEAMEDLGIVSGDIIEIQAKESVAVKVMRSLKDDFGKQIIRLDGTTRAGVGASIGDIVKIKKAKFQEA